LRCGTFIPTTLIAAPAAMAAAAQPPVDNRLTLTPAPLALPAAPLHAAPEAHAGRAVICVELLGPAIERIVHASRRHALSVGSAAAVGAKVAVDECDSLGASLRAFAALLGRDFRTFDGSLNARAAWKSAVHVILPLVAGITDSGGDGESENESDVRVGTCEPVQPGGCLVRPYPPVARLLG
jgi:hypothetical protein